MDYDTKVEHLKTYQKLQRKKRRTPREEQMLHSYKILEGGGLFDSIKAGVSKVASKIKDITSFAPRKAFSPADQKLIDTYGGRKITEIKVVRTPINRVVNAIIQMSSGGRFQAEAKRKGYDDFFHLYMLIFVEGLDKPILAEKNETPRYTLDVPANRYINSNTQLIIIPITKDITLKELIDNSVQNMGDSFWKYSYNQLNCQDFVARTLKASGLLTADAQKWIVQDVLNIGRTLHPVVAKALQGITDILSYGRKVLGKGLTLDPDKHYHRMPDGRMMKNSKHY